MSKQPILILVALPDTPTNVLNIFSQGPVWQLLETPGSLRYAGWNLETRDTARIVEGNYLEVRDEGKKVIQLYESGVLLVRAEATGSFLSWGSNEKDQLQTLNPLAIVEFTYSFVKLYAEILAHCQPRPIACSFRIRFENATSPQTLQLYEGTTLQIWQQGAMRKFQATADVMDKNLSVATELLIGDPSMIACKLLEMIYLWFGIPVSNVPYIIESGGIRRVDVALIENIGRN